MVVAKLCVTTGVTAVCALVLKSHKSELVPLCITAGGILMLLIALDYLTESIELIKQFSQAAGIDTSLVRTIFKIVGIGYVIELTASSVKDLGFESISDKLVLCGRIIIFLVSVPVLKTLYDVIVSLIGLA